jgi:hypothetical protein
MMDCGASENFFSNFSVALWKLHIVQAAGARLPDRVDFSLGAGSFRHQTPATEQRDLYPLFFQSAPGEPPGTRIPLVHHDRLYAFLDYDRINPVLRHYFRPSGRALAFQAALLRRYQIVPAHTIAVVHCGADPNSEVRLAKPESYLRLARQLLMRNPQHRLWIHTDEREVRDLFCEAFGERCFYVNNWPGLTDGCATDQPQDRTPDLPTGDFGVQLIAINHLLAQSDLIVNHTGNRALWLCLFRGHGRGVWQFDDEGRAINPQRPGAWFGAVRRSWIKASRRVRRALSGGGAARSAT